MPESITNLVVSKAKFCKEGLKETINFCTTHQIPFNQCGKLIVATSDEELSGMHDLYQRCKENEIEAEILDQQQLLKPNPMFKELVLFW